MTIEPINNAVTFQKQTIKQDNMSNKQNNSNEGNVAANHVKIVDAASVKSVGMDKTEEFHGDTKDSSKEPLSNGEQIKKAIEKLRKNMSHSEAIFGIHEETNRLTIKIVDSETKELIKELPPEKTLDMIARVWEMAGLLVDEKR